MTLRSIFIKQKSTWAGKIVAVLQAIHFFPLVCDPFALFHFPPFSRLPITTFLDMTERRRRIQTVDLGTSQAAVRESPIKINEILDRIFSFLDQRTLKSVAARVCSQWLHVAARRFQHRLVVNQEDSETWKDLPRRLSQATELTVGRPIRRRQEPGKCVHWRQMASQLEKALLELYKIDKHPRKERIAVIQPFVKVNLSSASTNKD